MPRRNYDRMYKEYNENPVVEETKEEIKQEKEIKEEKKSIIGTVIGGKNLNVRNRPDGDVIDSLKDGSKIKIADDSNPDWYKIEEPKGYVMRKFVKKED